MPVKKAKRKAKRKAPAKKKPVPRPPRPPSAKAFLSKLRSGKVVAPQPPPVPKPAARAMALFTYHGTLPGYMARSGQNVEIIRALDGRESEISEMYLIRAADGWMGHAREGELKR